MYDVIEVVTEDLQGSIVLCQEQEVAILSARIVSEWRASRMSVSSVHIIADIVKGVW